MLNHFSGKDLSISISTILSTSTAFLTLFMLFNEASNKENHDNQQLQELEGILGFITCVSDGLFQQVDLISDIHGKGVILLQAQNLIAYGKTVYSKMQNLNSELKNISFHQYRSKQSEHLKTALKSVLTP